MKSAEYHPGQRWVSSAEPESGLGIVVAVKNRKVEISFPAIGENRLYAVENAPLNRIQYREGDVIRNHEGDEFTVVEVVEKSGRYFYLCKDGAGDSAVVDELELDSLVTFGRPQDRLFAGQVDSLARYRLRRQTLEYKRRLQQLKTPGLLGARAQLLPHQFYIASEVASRHAPRVLLADEVGLGKTIEAGLILHQQLMTGQVTRVLIVVPETLIHQWLVEMLRRFNLMFTIVDEAKVLRFEDEDGADIFGGNSDNPFDGAQLVLCSLSFLVADGKRQAQARDAGWDLMIVDEAHHLHWEPGHPSAEYACIEGLAAEIPGLLLLTATPEQLGLDGHFARLRLLDPARYYSLEAFREEEAGYHQVRQLIEELLAEGAAERLLNDANLVARLSAYLGEDTARELRDMVAQDLEHEDVEQAFDDVVRSLVDRHGTGRVLFRNTRDTVSGFPDRQLNCYPQTPPEDYLDAEDAELMAKLRPEVLLGEAWWLFDPRVEWLSRWLPTLKDKAGKPEKVLIICAHADTAADLEAFLDIRQGIRTAVFHEGLSLIERDRAAAYFADEEESAQVLVCSEIGSEGRNFQFAHHLVLFDLPLNPDLLEQRIGRLDRIGQKHDVQIHVPHYTSGPQQILLDWYQQGLNAFERVCPIGGAVFEVLEPELRAVLEGSADAAALIAKTRQMADELLEKLRGGRDRLLELSSCHPRRSQEVIEAVSEAESPQALADYMEDVFDQFGVEHSYHSADALVLQPGDHMHCESFPGLLEGGMTVTFRRHKALSREDMHFLSWEHPMVTGVMDMVLGGDFGNATICTLKLPPMKPGTLLLEATFALHCPAPRELQLHRYLPLTTLRIAVDGVGNDLSDILTAAHLDKLGKKIDIATAQKVIRHARPQLSTMVQRCEALVAKKSITDSGEDMVAVAIKAMEKAQQAEFDRLEALARVNPNIRREELEFITELTAALRQVMSEASWRFDAIRVAIAT